MSREEIVGLVMAFVLSFALVAWLAVLPTLGAMWFLGFLGCSL